VLRDEDGLSGSVFARGAHPLVVEGHQLVVRGGGTVLDLEELAGLLDVGRLAVLPDAARDAGGAVKQPPEAIFPKAVACFRLKDGGEVARVVEHLTGAGSRLGTPPVVGRSEEHTSELQSRFDLVCRLLLEK